MAPEKSLPDFKPKVCFGAGSVMPTAEELLARTEPPQWVQDTLPFEEDVKTVPQGDPEYLTGFLVMLDHDLKPTIFLKAADWADRDWYIGRDASPFDVDVVNLYVSKFRDKQ